MIGNLTDAQIDELLHKEIVGRIGCHTKEMVYIVPLSYAYDGENIYAHTYEGLKLAIMRKNPDVCFEVDNLKDMGNWQSVITWGKFSELVDKAERDKALMLLLNRVLPPASSDTTHLGSSWPFYSDKLEDIGGVVIRINLTKRTGKFESSTSTPAING